MLFAALIDNYVLELYSMSIRQREKEIPYIQFLLLQNVKIQTTVTGINLQQGTNKCNNAKLVQSIIERASGI